MKSGVAYALVSAVLFGISTPLAKVLVGEVPPVMLAGLLYAGSGVGLALVMTGRRLLTCRVRAMSLPTGREWLWLGGAIFFGGVVGPVLLMRGLVVTPASTASLMLQPRSGLYGVAGVVLVPRATFDRRVALGMLAIVAGGVVLSWQLSPGSGGSVRTLLVAAACLCWAVDNNLTRRVSSSDATLIAGVKGIVAAFVNLGFAAALGYEWPSAQVLTAAATLGFVGYGVSLTLFVLALRHLGTAWAGAYFAGAPFFGAALAIVLHDEGVTWQLAAAGVLMATGVWLHVTEHHEHHHIHVPETHSHEHIHDAHHQHAQDEERDGSEPHVHTHTHASLSHTHEHYPDVHHRHEH